MRRHDKHVQNHASPGLVVEPHPGLRLAGDWLAADHESDLEKVGRSTGGSGPNVISL
ncbi:MAG TPA: hypothetical protein VKE25_07090 [Actinomycetes bacterium]|nr:hypothetical protein [Actinomycetes bacterium]